MRNKKSLLIISNSDITVRLLLHVVSNGGNSSQVLRYLVEKNVINDIESFVIANYACVFIYVENEISIRSALKEFSSMGFNTNEKEG